MLVRREFWDTTNLRPMYIAIDMVIQPQWMGFTRLLLISEGTSLFIHKPFLVSYFGASPEVYVITHQIDGL
jgi:hypothetical protein